MTTDNENRAPAGGQSDPVAAMRELAIRFIQPLFVRYGPYGPSIPTGQPEVLPGQLPPSPPVELPVPNGSRIVGTVVQDGNSTTVLDAPLSADAVLAFYRERMAALGWTEREMPTYPPQRQGGFTHTPPRRMHESVLFFQGPRGPSLNVIATLDPRPDALTEVNLRFEATPPERSHGPYRQHWSGLQEMIPPLEAPAGAALQGGGSGGGSGGSWHSHASLQTDRDLAAIAAHYDAQLGQGGWQLSRSGVTPPVAWSTWTLTDKDREPWRGSLVILQHAEDAQHYILDLHLDWTGANPGGGGSGAYVRSGVFM